MDKAVAGLKKELRKRVLGMRDAMPEHEIVRKSGAASARLRGLKEFKSARTVMLFASFGSEIRTGTAIAEAIAAGKAVLLPKTDWERRMLVPSRVLDPASELEPAAFGIPEPRNDALRPVDPADIDLLVVPGAAFDLRCNRMGYGGGFYDAFLPRLRPGVPLVALTFDIQVVDSVPVESHDRPVDAIVTESRTIRRSEESR